MNVATSALPFALPATSPAADRRHHYHHRHRHDEKERLAGTAERVAATVGGAALLGLAGRRRPLLGMSLALAGAPLVYRGLTGHWPVTRGMAALGTGPIEVEAGITIARSAADLYSFWRKLENLPRFMHGLESVTETGDGRSHWVGHLQFGLRPRWDAEIIEDLPGRLLSWRSMPGARVHNAGVVLFEEIPDIPLAGGAKNPESPQCPQNVENPQPPKSAANAAHGSAVRVIMELMPAGAGLGRAVGRALRAATEQQVREDLRRFKCLMEAGEVPTTEGQPSGGQRVLA